MAQEKTKLAMIKSSNDEDVDLLEARFKEQLNVSQKSKMSLKPPSGNPFESKDHIPIQSKLPESSKSNNYSAKELNNNGQADSENLKNADVAIDDEEEKHEILTDDKTNTGDKATFPSQIPQQRPKQQSTFPPKELMKSQILEVITDMVERGIITVNDHVETESQAINPALKAIRDSNSKPSLSEEMSNYDAQSSLGSRSFMVQPETGIDTSNYVVDYVHQITGMNGNSKDNHGKRGVDNDNDDRNGDNNDRSGRNPNNGNNNGRGYGYGNGSGGNNNNNDNNNGNNFGNNGNNDQDTNARIITALEQISYNQQLLIGKKDNNKYKLPKCNIKFYGRKKNGEKEDLVKIAWEVKLWCSLKGIGDENLLTIWLSDVLQDPAKEKIYRQIDDIQSFDDLIKILNIIYPIKSKIHDVLKEFRKFKYLKYTSMEGHLNEYKIIISKMNKETWIWKKIGTKGRAPELPTIGKQWNCLEYSIRNCPDIHKGTIAQVQRFNPKVFHADYELVPNDIKLLTKSMLMAASSLYPNNEMQRFDVTGTPRFQRSYGSNRGRGRDRKSGRDNSGRGRPPRRDRNKRKGLNYQNTKKEFKGECYACSGQHPVRVCKDEHKKKQYCRDNNLCLFCCKEGHKIKECNEFKEWKKKKAGGNDNNNNNGNNQNKYQNKSKRKWNRSAIRYGKDCRHGDNCKFKQKCYYLHDGDIQVSADESNDDETYSENSEDSQNDEARRERVNYLGNKSKARIHVAKPRSTLETCRIDRYKLTPDQIPKDEQITLYLKKNDEDMVKHPALLDSGSTISAITPRLADKVMKETGLKSKKMKNFMVENGSGNDVEFNGKYLIIPTLVPNSKYFEEIQYFIMPHNECAFGIILGLSDSQKLRYVRGLEIEDGKVLLEHRGDNRQRMFKAAEDTKSIMDRLNNYPGHVMGDTYFKCYQDQATIDDIDEDSFSDDDSDSASDDSKEDEDSEDGIRRSH